jgi:hypothetical protein
MDEVVRFFSCPYSLPHSRLTSPCCLFDVLHGGQQHAAGATGRVVDGLGFLGIEHVDHQPHDAARGVELAGLLVGGVGELLDQVFVGVAKQVRVDVLVAKRQLGEVLDQVLEQGIRQPILVRPLGIAEHAVQGVGVGLLNLAHRALKGRPDIAGLGANVVPVAVLGIWKRCDSGNQASCSSPVSSTISWYSSSQTSQMRLKNSSGKM